MSLFCIVFFLPCCLDPSTDESFWGTLPFQLDTDHWLCEIVFQISLHNETRKTCQRRRNSVVYTFAKKGVGSLVCLPLGSTASTTLWVCVEDFSTFFFFVVGVILRNRSRRAGVDSQIHTRQENAKGDKSNVYKYGSIYLKVRTVCKCCCDQTYFLQ